MSEEIKLPEEPSFQATKELEKAAAFWQAEGVKLIKQLIDKLNQEGAGREAAVIAKIWKDVDDRWIEIAAKIAPYQSAKKANVQVDVKHEKRFVIVAPTRTIDKKEWLQQVESDQKLLPKPHIIDTITAREEQINDIDEIEYSEINE